MTISKPLHLSVVCLASLLFATAGWTQADAETDVVSAASPQGPPIDNSDELPVRHDP